MVFAVITLLWYAPATRAAELPPDLTGSEIQLFIENDSFGSTDRYYTNGFKIGIGVPLQTMREVLQPLPKKVLDLFSDHKAEHHFGIFLGQNLYTPRNITVAAPQPFDRPWAAWLYLGGVAQRVYRDHLHTVELDVGFVGPPALGRQVHTNWHKNVIDSPEPRGWANQIRGEPGFLLSYVHKRKYGTPNIEFVPHAGVMVGTIMTLVRLGGVVRVGQNMTGFGVDGIEPGGAMLKNTRREYGPRGHQPYEWSVFAGVDGRLVGHNIFLDGSLFRDGPSVSRRDAVYDILAGVSARLDVIRVSVTRINRSEEFATPAGGGRQRFYSINVGIEF